MKKASQLTFDQYFASKFPKIRNRIRHKGLPCMSKRTWTKFLKRTFAERFKLWIIWKQNGFPLRLSPSINRLNNSKGYIPRNVEWITHSKNSMLSRRNSTTCLKGHPWVEENLITSEGYPRCRICKRNNQIRWERAHWHDILKHKRDVY